MADLNQKSSVIYVAAGESVAPAKRPTTARLTTEALEAVTTMIAMFTRHRSHA